MKPILPHGEPGASASGVDIIHPTTPYRVTLWHVSPRKRAGLLATRQAGHVGEGALSMSGATLPCAVALSPLSTQISARGVVTASTGSRCASLHLPRDLPTEGPPTPERNELVKRRAAGRKNISPGVFRHSAVKDIVKSQNSLL